MRETKAILSRYSVLYAEDEPSVQKSTAEYLQRYFKAVYIAGDGEEALRLYASKRPDAMILDIAMPSIDGLSVARRVRTRDRSTVIVMLTAFTDTEKLLQATELQLCKYLVKPVSLVDFKRTLKKMAQVLDERDARYLMLDASYRWDLRAKRLLHGDTPVKLTPKEAALLELFVANLNRCVSYAEIMATVWEEHVDSDVSIESVKLQVHFLRKKLPADTIHNVYGRGYLLKAKM